MSKKISADMLSKWDSSNFTNYIRDRSYEIIESFRPKKGKMQFISEKSYEDIVKYLNDNRYTLSFGHALKRVIIEKFNLYDNVNEDTLVETLYDAFCAHSIPITERNDTNRDLTNIEKDRIRKWFSKDSGNRKLFLSKISFALEMRTNDVSKFMTKGLAEQSYNHREMEEIILFFCHHNNLPYSKYIELYTLFTESSVAASNEETNYEKSDNEYSSKFKRDFEYIFKNEESLHNFIIENKSNFTRIRKSSTKCFFKLYNDLLSLLNEYETKTRIRGRKEPDYKWTIMADNSKNGYPFDGTIKNHLAN